MHRGSWNRAWAAVVAALVVAGTVGVGASAASPSDPPFSVASDQLEAALDCPAFVHPDREPVLLVHGTGTRGHEQFDWNWLQVLPAMGFDVCVVTYPDRGLIDQQVSAEYVAYAVMAMHAATGRPVDLMGHSQGASMPRWAVRFWPSVRDAIDDFVGIAGPYHGTDVTGGDSFGGQLPAAFFQFQRESRFTTIVNDGDETPGDIDWTNIATAFDELVLPTDTAFLDRDLDNPRVANLLVQELCPGRLVDHLTIGTTDRLAFDLAVDAFTHAGPADPARLQLDATCSVADQIVDGPDQALSLADLVFQGVEAGLPDLHLRSSEPPTMGYATSDSGSAPSDDAGAASSPPPAADGEPPAAGAEPAAAPAVDAADGRRGLPATGGGSAAVALGSLLLLAQLGRRRGQRRR